MGWQSDALGGGRSERGGAELAAADVLRHARRLETVAAGADAAEARTALRLVADVAGVLDGITAELVERLSLTPTERDRVRRLLSGRMASISDDARRVAEARDDDDPDPGPRR